MAGVDEAIGRVRALKPGKTEIKVFVLGLNRPRFPWKSRTEEITELTAEPAVAGDGRRRAPTLAGLRPGRRLRASRRCSRSPISRSAPQKGGTVDVIGGEDVQAKAIGEDTIDIAWRDKLKIAVPVKVAANVDHGSANHSRPKRRSTPARRSPTRSPPCAAATAWSSLHEDGVRLSVTDPTVASVASGTTVSKHRPRTNQGDRRLRRTKGRGRPERHPGVAGVTPIGSGVDVIHERCRLRWSWRPESSSATARCWRYQAGRQGRRPGLRAALLSDGRPGHAANRQAASPV